MRRILVSPGPVEVPAALWRRGPTLHHRSEEFRRMVTETESMLQELLGSTASVYLLTSSGTGAMEAAIANVTDEGSRVLVVSGGKFGDRWAEISRAFGCETELLRFSDGTAIDPSVIRARIERSRPEILALTHVESSTGLLLSMRELAGSLARERPLVILDAISSVGVEDLEMDRWGIDMVIGACQKVFAAPPGVAFVAVGSRASDLVRKGREGLYYFDLKRYESGRERGDAPFTPAIHTIQAIHESLLRMKRLGFDRVKERHRAASRSFLEAAERLSLHSFSENPSSSVQVLALPEGCQGKKALEKLARSGFIAADGQGELKGRVVRFGFLGLLQARTLERLVVSLGEIMEGLGGAVDLAEARKAVKNFSPDGYLFQDS